MSKSRIESLSDGVIAIIMTILVLELRAPVGDGFGELWFIRNKILIYVISFMTVAIYWMNHHNLLQLTNEVNSRILWTNLGFLFSLTFFPFATAWYGTHLWGVAPAFTYAIVVFMANVLSMYLARDIFKLNEKNKNVVAVLGNTTKLQVSLVMSALAIAVSFLMPNATLVVITAMLLIWLVPNPRMLSYFDKKK